MKTTSGHDVCLSFSQPDEKLTIWVNNKSYTLFGFCDFFARHAKIGLLEDPEWDAFCPYEPLSVYGGLFGLSYIGQIRLNIDPVEPAYTSAYLRHLVSLANAISCAPVYKDHTSFLCE